MRLLTHNVLQCPRTQAYPLKLEVRELENVEVEYDKDFILRMLPRLDWGVLCQTAREVSRESNLIRDIGAKVCSWFPYGH